MRCAQVLATKRDFDEGKHRENMINCYDGLLSQGIVPIANEDDAVSLSMSMFSDNAIIALTVSNKSGYIFSSCLFCYINF